MHGIFAASGKQFFAVNGSCGRPMQIQSSFDGEWLPKNQVRGQQPSGRSRLLLESHKLFLEASFTAGCGRFKTSRVTEGDTVTVDHDAACCSSDLASARSEQI